MHCRAWHIELPDAIGTPTIFSGGGEIEKKDCHLFLMLKENDKNVRHQNHDISSCHIFLWRKLKKKSCGFIQSMEDNR